MNILYDHQIFSIQKYGGLSRYVYELLVRLLKIKTNHLSLFAGFSLNRFGIEKCKPDFYKFWSYVYNEVPKTKMLVFDLNTFLMKFFVKNLNTDIYHQTYYAPLLKDHKGIRVVTMLDMTHELFPESFNKFDKTIEWKKESIKLADAIICISESTKADLINMYGFDEKKITVTYLGNSIQADVSNVKTKKPFILFVGARKGYKNFQTLFNVYKRSGKFQSDFDLICFGGGQFNEYERKQIADSSLTGKIKFVSGDDVLLSSYYNSAEIFVYPSKYEGFGIPPLEAMSLGCPVIAGNKSSIPEVVGNGGLLFDPESEDHLFEAMNTLLYDEDKKLELIQRGLIQSKKFSWDKCAEETQKFYEKIF